MSLTYNPANGLPTGTTLGNVTTSQTYSSYGELASYEAKYGTSTIFNTSYTRDSLGRISTLNETIEGESNTYAYSYDQVGRLIEVKKNGVLVSSYSYDSNGNRLSHWTPTITDSGIYDTQDRLLNYANTSYTYTPNGELQTKVVDTDTTIYKYDSFGNLIEVVLSNGDVIEYIVDGQNRRIAKKINGTIIKKWLYARQLSPIAELDITGNIISRFAGGYFTKNGVTYQLIVDHLGSIRLVVNVITGGIVQRIDYDEFGNVTQNTNPDFQPFGYAGGLYDTQTKLVRFGARDYDASVGRWQNKERMRFVGSNNFYSYSKNDPINLIDRNGLWPTGSYGSREIHQESIDRELSFLSPNDRAILKQAQVTADADPYQDPASSFRHAMRDGTNEQTIAQAMNAANDFVRSQIALAQKLECEGKHEDALKALGLAMHTLQDATSPEHKGFQPWGGGTVEGIVHSAGELVPNPSQMLELDIATTDAYLYFIGAQPLPKSFFK